MKFNKMITLLIIAALTFGFYSCSEKEGTPEKAGEQGEVKDDAKKDVKDGDITKDDVLNFMKDGKAYMESDEFYNDFKSMMIELSKDPNTMMEKMGTEMQAKMEAKFLEIGKKYGFNSEEEFKKYENQFKDDPEIKAFDKEMDKAGMAIFTKMVADEEFMNALPAEAKAMFEMMGGAAKEEKPE